MALYTTTMVEDYAKRLRESAPNNPQGLTETSEAGEANRLKTLQEKFNGKLGLGADVNMAPAAKQVVVVKETLFEFMARKVKVTMFPKRNEENRKADSAMGIEAPKPVSNSVKKTFVDYPTVPLKSYYGFDSGLKGVGSVKFQSAPKDAKLVSLTAKRRDERNELRFDKLNECDAFNMLTSLFK